MPSDRIALNVTVFPAEMALIEKWANTCGMEVTFDRLSGDWLTILVTPTKASTEVAPSSGAGVKAARPRKRTERKKRPVPVEQGKSAVAVTDAERSEREET